MFHNTNYNKQSTSAKSNSCSHNARHMAPGVTRHSCGCRPANFLSCSVGVPFQEIEIRTPMRGDCLFYVLSPLLCCCTHQQHLVKDANWFWVCVVGCSVRCTVVKPAQILQPLKPSPLELSFCSQLPAPESIGSTCLASWPSSYTRVMGTQPVGAGVILGFQLLGFFEYTQSTLLLFRLKSVF